jgi:hypothetical protein
MIKCELMINIESDNPVEIKSKGDEFVKKGDYSRNSSLRRYINDLHKRIPVADLPSDRWIGPPHSDPPWKPNKVQFFRAF